MPRRDYSKVAFAATGDTNIIPTATQPDGTISLQQGWGFDYQRDNGAGGGTPDPLAKNIAREDMNGIFNEITASLGEIQQNGFAIWVATAAPYPINSFIRYPIDGKVYRSLIDNNSAVPGGVEWEEQNRPATPVASGLIGSSVNLRASLSAASASITITADEVIVKSALGGLAWNLPTFSKTLNLSTVGAGGMDAGIAPASGFVSIYAIYNPSNQATALMACNQSTSSGRFYTGGNMPSGYTASGLVSAWRTDASRLMIVGSQVDRQISIPIATILSTTSIFTNAPASLAAIVPIATVEIGGLFQSGAATANVNSTVGLSSTSTGYGSRSGGGTSSVGNAVTQSSYDGLKVSVSQTVYLTTTVGSGALFQAAAYITSYTI